MKKQNQGNIKIEKEANIDNLLPVQEKAKIDNLQKEANSYARQLPVMGEVKEIETALEGYEENELEDIVQALKRMKEIVGSKILGKEKDGASSCLVELIDQVKREEEKLGNILEDFYYTKLEWACFPEGTMIHTKEGLRAIEEIQVGDLLYAGNEKTGEFGLQEVTAVFERAVHKLIEIKIGQEEIRSTVEHPFWIEGKGYIEAENLEAEDKVVCLNDNKFVTYPIEKVKIILQEDAVLVYNLRIEEWHTYFAGKVGVWVHNADDDKYKDSSGEAKKESEEDKKTRKKTTAFGNLNTQEIKDFRERIDKAEAENDIAKANDIRYERYCLNKEKEGKKPLSREEWDTKNERVKVNNSSGYQAESVAREILNKQFRYDLVDNNETGQRLQKTVDDKTVRPDSIHRNTENKVDIVHDHKHLIGGEKQEIYNTKQLRIEKEMLETKDGIFIVTMSSDKPNLSAKPPEPRPSEPLEDEAVIYYINLKERKVTHEWRNGKWEPITT